MRKKKGTGELRKVIRNSNSLQVCLPAEVIRKNKIEQGDYMKVFVFDNDRDNRSMKDGDIVLRKVTVQD